MKIFPSAKAVENCANRACLHHRANLVGRDTKRGVTVKPNETQLYHTKYLTHGIMSGVLLRARATIRRRVAVIHLYLHVQTPQGKAEISVGGASTPIPKSLRTEENFDSCQKTAPCRFRGFRVRYFTTGTRTTHAGYRHGDPELQLWTDHLEPPDFGRRQRTTKTNVCCLENHQKQHIFNSLSINKCFAVFNHLNLETNLPACVRKWWSKVI